MNLAQQIYFNTRGSATKSSRTNAWQKKKNPGHGIYFFALVFKFQVLFVTYTTIQRLYNQQWNESQVRSMDSANIVEYNTREVYIK